MLSERYSKRAGGKEMRDIRIVLKGQVETETQARDLIEKIRVLVEPLGLSPELGVVSPEPPVGSRRPDLN